MGKRKISNGVSARPTARKAELATIVVAAWLAVAAVIAAPAAAASVTDSISGTSDWNGKTYFGTARYHDVGGMSFTLTADSQFCGGGFQFGVRDVGTLNGTQLPKTQFTALGGPKSLVWYTGSYTIPTGNYSVVTYAFGACGGTAGKVNWSGLYTH